MNILLVTEEYGKLTKGLFRVWSTICAHWYGADSTHLLINKEHWLNSSGDLHLPGVAEVHALSHPMPQTMGSRAAAGIGNKLIAGIVRFAIRNSLSLLFAPLVAVRLALLARKLRLTKMICHHGGWPAGSFVRWSMLASSIAGIDKTILVIHSLPAPYSRAFGLAQKAEEWMIGRCATEIITVSQAAADALMQRSFGRQVRVIHNGLDVSGASEPTTSVTEGPPVIGFLGALIPNKGAHILLEAALLLDAGQTLSIAGPGVPEYVEMLRRQPAAQAHRVQFLGELEDVHGFLAGIDVLVVPSIAFEAFGMVILEAMLHSKPVVCSDIGGMKEIVVDEETGFIVPAGDAIALAAALRRLLGSPELRTRMGKAGYHRLMDCFTAERMAEQYHALLE